MFYYLIYNSTIIKKDALKNKNITTLIYGTIVYILIHALIYINKSIKDTLLRYFWVIFSVDIVCIFLSTDISSEIQNHNFTEEKEIKKKKRKKIEIVEQPIEVPSRKQVKEKKRVHPEEKPKKVLKNKELKSNSIQDLQRERMEMDFKPNNNIDIQTTQNILDEIELNSDDSGEKKKVTFDIPDDAKSEVSDGSDLEIDLESFEKSLLED